MENAVKLLSKALTMAELAHAAYEKKMDGHGKVEWPDFYAQWLFDNVQLWVVANHQCEDGNCSVSHD